MDHLCVGKPSAAKLSKLGPGHPVCPLLPASQNFQPDFLDRYPKLVQARRVQWDCVVIAPPLVDTRQSGVDFRKVPMHNSFQRFFGAPFITTRGLFQDPTAEPRIRIRIVSEPDRQVSETMIVYSAKRKWLRPEYEGLQECPSPQG